MTPHTVGDRKTSAKLIFRSSEQMAKWFETMPKSAVESCKQYLQTAVLNEDVHLSDERCLIFALKEQCRRPSEDQTKAATCLQLILLSGKKIEPHGHLKRYS